MTFGPQLVYVVEDDPKIAAIVSAHLRKYGYEVAVAQDFGAVRHEFLALRPQLVLLDVNLPQFDGYHWCRQIRAVSTVPIIFLTARSGEMDQVMAIEHGGDDHLSKPFSLDVLLSKVKSVLRRTYGEYAGTVAHDDVVRVGSLGWDRARLQLTSHERRTTLSRNEGLLLDALVRADGRVVRREALLEALWSDVDFVDDNTLTVNVTRLRRRLGALGLPDAIDTVRGQGYRLTLPGG